jgi:5-methylcytosine-specific restriction endonuclease McrA
MKNHSHQLHQKLLNLALQERKILATIITHLQEVSDHKLFLDFGRTSMLDYCIKDLGYSESAAIRRIKALKLLRAVPEAATAISDGSLTLSQAATMQVLFERHSQEKRQSLPAVAKKEILEQIKNLPARESEQAVRAALGLPKKARKVQIEMSEETFQKWLEFKGRMVNKNWSDEKLLDYLLEREKENQRSHKRHPAVATKTSVVAKNQRYISANVRRELRAVAKHCQWPGCASTYGLELDHVRPIAQNGPSTRENLRVLCKNHNLWRS